MKDNFYFTGNLDLKRCGIWQVLLIALLHKLLFLRKYCYMQHYPAFSQIAASYLAHRSFYLYNMAVWIKKLILRFINR
ncbi:hypothetical protein [Candidatus Magnetominusculus xianensis]|uniref:Uncharacterized protein n=1 Tax=Candidatus Magnetominusculus xianensis TaxID=1748249 RepID=A0ABR5SID0_9BACT|nr:hypothetical protein [Candidatus Magnetominusculus xianensis]KWT91073.1 hypothetical protein ASN18_0897 [Candidatus Magnetominusculus xianensis]MBF0403282.1 hypothetical protein [Nitrospirota bacterium]